MSNTKEIFKRYSNYKKGFLEEDKLMDFDGFNKALGEILSLPVELRVSDANSVHIDNIYNLIDACFTETYDDIRRHAPDNQILIADYLRATKIKLINEISCLSR